MFELNTIQLICVFALPVLLAITVHEVAHGWVANKLGDPTARMLGRLTLNPLKHIDILGTVIVPLCLLFAGGVIFGWAKPVPITWQNLKRPRRDMALVALAGPAANLIMAIIWAAIAKLGQALYGSLHQNAVAIVYMGMAGIMINLFLMVFNLLPIPPLDGSRVVSTLLKGRAYYYYNLLEPYGLFILLFLLLTGALFTIIGPPILTLQKILITVFLR